MHMSAPAAWVACGASSSAYSVLVGDCDVGPGPRNLISLPILPRVTGAAAVMPIRQAEGARDRERELAGPCRGGRTLPHACAAAAQQLASSACGRMHAFKLDCSGIRHTRTQPRSSRNPPQTRDA